ALGCLVAIPAALHGEFGYASRRTSCWFADQPSGFPRFLWHSLVFSSALVPFALPVGFYMLPLSPDKTGSDSGENGTNDNEASSGGQKCKQHPSATAFVISP